MTVDVAMLVPSTLSLTCVAGARSSWRAHLVGAVMFLGMVIAALPAPLTGLLLLAAAALIGVAPVAFTARRDAMETHRALSAIVMAAALVLSGSQMHADTGGHVHAGAFTVILGGGFAAYLLFSGWVITHRCLPKPRHPHGHAALLQVRQLLGAAEVASMVAGSLLMVAM
jgi:hypothetical protein